jgi:membrane-associated phospholipid phosphatase
MEKIIEQLNNSSPELIGIYLLLSKQYNILQWYVFSFILNLILKEICRKCMKDKTFPLIGNGNRPPGSNLNSYGMPSGHAQVVGFFLMSQILLGNKNWPVILLLSLEIMWSRILNGHHTFSQVAIGFLLGLSLANALIHNNIMKI